MTEKTRHLLGLNQFANPVDAPGGTRLVELTERLDGWDTTIVAAGRNLFTREVHAESRRDFRTVWTSPYAENGYGRILNWVTYSVSATALGLRLRPKPDVVYASSPHLLVGLAGWIIARTRSVPFVLEIRDLWPQILADAGRLDASSRAYRLIKRLERFLYRRSDAVVVLAEGVGAAVRAEGVPAARVHFIPNGAEPEDFVVAGDREGLRTRFGFRGVTVVYAGAHGPANGLDFVLDAAAELRDEVPDAFFVLVGDGMSKPALVARAHAEGLTNVAFLDPVAKQVIPEMLAAADVGVHVLADLPLFKYGVSPNKLFDYMASGLPVLTNTAGEVGALVEDNDAGVLVRPDGLADGVRRLVDAGAAARASWGANGRAFMVAHRSRSEMAVRLQVLLDRIVDGSTPDSIADATPGSVAGATPGSTSASVSGATPGSTPETSRNAGSEDDAGSAPRGSTGSAGTDAAATDP